jgi:hypothetical protein
MLDPPSPSLPLIISSFFFIMLTALTIYFIISFAFLISSFGLPLLVLGVGLLLPSSRSSSSKLEHTSYLILVSLLEELLDISPYVSYYALAITNNVGA